MTHEIDDAALDRLSRAHALRCLGGRGRGSECLGMKWKEQSMKLVIVGGTGLIGSASTRSSAGASTLATTRAPSCPIQMRAISVRG